ncbi:putative disease resistance protein [Panicum miliaceum]|uniref:Disease resistance protein n=1 Tax=Panicum miliaceum TaxID=4540 RepID=A0A3L6TJ22_PANMI|nr:putative disease resistance protein [Panicum miliaceum]
MVEPAVSSVVGGIKDLAVQETTLLCGVIGEAGFLKDELQRLQGFLKDADTKQRSGSESAAIWVSQIRGAAYEAENVLEDVDHMKKRSRLKKGIVGAISSDLPNHYLKSCFLYLAVFPEDYSISVLDLIELWIAEGFIPHTTKRKQEQIARKYASELAQRSLVQVVSKCEAHGWIEKIRVHDSLHDWCVEEARYAGFVDVVDSTSGHVGESSSNTMISYRSSFQNYRDGKMNPATPNLRTLVGFGLSSFSLPKLRFLRVLHVEKSSLINFGSAISGCIHLRYLRLRWCEHVTLPSSIGQFLYLQTIDLRDTRLESVPNSIWDIPTLRHVYLERGFSAPKNCPPKELQSLHLDIPDEEVNCFETLPKDSFGSKCCDLVFTPLRSGGWMEVEAMPRLSRLVLGTICWNTKLLPEGLLHLPSLKELELHLQDMDLISEDDVTLKKLRGKGCKVTIL